MANEIRLFSDDYEVSTGGEVVSVEISGLNYRRKTIYLFANGSGIIEVQGRMMSGRWRTIVKQDYNANELWVYVFDVGVTRFRVKFRNTSGDVVKIHDSMVVLE